MCVDVLLGAGADLEARDEVGKAPLHYAVQLSAEHEAVKVAQALLAAGADTRAVEANGRTPLHIAQHACVDVLLDAGAELEARDSEGMTPIQLAARRKCRRVLRLAQRGAVVTSDDLVVRQLSHMMMKLCRGEARERAVDTIVESLAGVTYPVHAHAHAA